MTSGAPAALIGKQLTRRFGTTLALRGASLAVERGERLALLGPNGAGKTTLMRILALALSPTSGSLTVGGLDAKHDSPGARRLVGFISHRTGLYDDLTARENLRFYGRLYGSDSLDARLARVLAEVGISDSWANVPVRTLSRGMQQRVGLARAVLHDPIVLLMDEPETGLDPQGQEWLIELVNRLAARGGSVVVATHRLDWVERFADRAIVLDNGTLRADLLNVKATGSPLTEAYRRALGEAP